MATYYNHHQQLMLVFLFCYSISMAFQLHYCRAAAYVESGHCKRKCGQMDIPYPFGITRGCYLDETFVVACNESAHTLTSESQYSHGREIDFISIPDHLIRRTKIELYSTERYNASGETNDGRFTMVHATNATFQLPPNRNNLVFVGCDFYAYLVDNDTRKFLEGCASLCNRDDIAPSDPSSCSGLGCCQLKYPGSARNIAVWVETMNTESRSWNDTCIYVGIAEKDSFTFIKKKSMNCNETYYRSIMYEWHVRNMSCTSSSVCGRHTSCHDSDIGAGYQCKCLHGFTGNPYILDGCKDINECKGPEGNRCPKNTYCFNTDGSYECLPNRTQQYVTTPGKIIIFGTSLALGLLTLVSVGLWLHWKLKKIRERKLKLKFFMRNGGLLLLQQQTSPSSVSQIESKLFKAEELGKATDNFCESRVLGKGGLGTVYKGMLQDGSIVAVKIANVVDESQVGQFINEVFILSEIKHRHIIKLLGCCLETQVPRLVYEYVSNGTLHQHLHSSFSNSSISWENRLRIAAEIAGALAYLHSYASTAIIHRDIKSSNILLDENYRAVVSDFGLSRSVSIDRTHITTVVGGTFGYLDPEYFRSGQLTDKSDVYAFGVILAELLTGRKPISYIEDEGSLVVCFQTALEENRLSEILDQNVAGEAQEEEIKLVAQLCERCVKLNSRQRPSMRDVAAELERLRRPTVELRNQESIIDDDHQFPSVIMEKCDSTFVSSDYEAEDDTIVLSSVRN